MNLHPKRLAQHTTKRPSQLAMHFRLANRLRHCARLLATLLCCCISISSYADNNSVTMNATQPMPMAGQNMPTPALPPVIIPAPPQLNASSYVLMDAQNGQIIVNHNMDKRLPPASLTKMMTLYIASNEIKSGQIKLDDKTRVSKKAWSMGGSKMFLKEGSWVTVQNLIHGIIVDSGNDACVALAQYIAGNEPSFAQLMNQTAKALGMNDSHFTDSTGLPHPDHYSTAHNLAILARALIINFPEDYKWYKQKWLTYNGIRQSNRNLLLWRDPSVDGLKTGHTKAAGYCLVSSALRNNTRLISVVMGTPSTNARAESSQALLNYGFRFYRSKKLYRAQQPITNTRVWFANKKDIQLGTLRDVYVTLAINNTLPTRLVTHINPHLTAPISRGEVCGSADVMQGKKLLQHVVLVSLENNQRAGSIGQLRDRIMLWFHKRLHG